MYIYKADTWCDDCAVGIKASLPERPLGDYDSDDYPKGPFDPEESDSPQHCAGCQVFLENPLTSDGYKYVRESIEEAIVANSVTAEWFEFYGFSIESDEA